MMDQNEKKLNVAKAAIKHIHNDCLLGMGTGSTVNFLIDLLLANFFSVLIFSLLDIISLKKRLPFMPLYNIALEPEIQVG